MDDPRAPDARTYYPPPPDRLRYDVRLGGPLRGVALYAGGSHRARRLIRRYVVAMVGVALIIGACFLVVGALMGFR